MFIYNINLKKIKFVKIGICILIAIALIAFMVLLRSNAKKTDRVYVTDSTYYEEVTEIPVANYTNILKDCHENLDKYIGKKIKFSGFVHRLYDFSDNQFILAREMITNSISESQAEVVIVGFLCDYKGASSFADNTWVEIEGTISKGYYHSEIPVIQITSIKNTDCPENPYVCPPNGGYVKTES